MPETSTNVENYDESLMKCKKINKVIPGVCQNIQQMQKIDRSFSSDFNLILAEQFLHSLDALEQPHNDEEKMTYVNEFRDHLTSGLRSLGSFFDNFPALELLTEEQRSKISHISANIVISQDSIIKIASS